MRSRFRASACGRAGAAALRHIAASSILAVLCAGAANAGGSVDFSGATYVNKGLVGVGRVPSNALDKYSETLGGFGSGMALDLPSWKKDRRGFYSGQLYMLPDRGWNTQGTTDFRGRLQHFEIRLTPFYGAATASQNQLSLNYRSSTLFRGGLTTGFDAIGVKPAAGHFPDLPVGQNGKLAIDAEAVVRLNDGSSWISDEYGAYVYHFGANGRLIDALRPPEAFIPKRKNAAGEIVENFSANSPPVGVTYNPSLGNPLMGRQNNQGFEGLAMSPDRKTLFVLLQSALIQDLDPSKISTTRRNTRLLAYDLSRGAPKLKAEYVVQLPLYQDQTTANPKLLTAAQSELFALNDHQFLVLARDSGGGFAVSNPGSVYRSVDLIDISGATNIAGGQYDAAGGSIAPLGVLSGAITPVAYQKFLDINEAAELAKFNLHNGLPNDGNDLYEKWESIAVAPVGDAAAPNDYFLFVGSDNDFITQNGRMAGVAYQDASGFNVDTLVLVYRVTLPTYVAPGRPRR
ncbi:conserved hypothetical protein [Methylocella silvestris BL2]|uniref:Phytase-like domain-containing protein n=1 Tax=Methylocella silvestris (strain DSM 15510 / CIP 108128 / LMG 27833 / NCIMB 13906 / BL2) TaxID=395965 RepID=B8EQ10_METSB|nr:conserved hypothetical protein [Methylocella silvestris BL2]